MPTAPEELLHTPIATVEPDLVDALVQAAFGVIAVLNRVAAQHDLSLTQLRMLGILRDRQPGVTELAGHLGLEKSTVSGLVDRATRRGLIERAIDPVDGRAVRVRLSDDGIELARSMEGTVATLLTPLTSGLTRTEQRRLHELLGHLG